MALQSYSVWQNSHNHASYCTLFPKCAQASQKEIHHRSPSQLCPPPAAPSPPPIGAWSALPPPRSFGSSSKWNLGSDRRGISLKPRVPGARALSDEKERRLDEMRKTYERLHTNVRNHRKQQQTRNSNIQREMSNIHFTR